MSRHATPPLMHHVTPRQPSCTTAHQPSCVTSRYVTHHASRYVTPPLMSHVTYMRYATSSLMHVASRIILRRVTGDTRLHSTSPPFHQGALNPPPLRLISTRTSGAYCHPRNSVRSAHSGTRRWRPKPGGVS